MDYDQEAQMLYTGDEMGYMNKWDISKLISRLNDLKPKDESEDNNNETDRSAKKSVKRAATFITGFNENLVKA